MSDEQWKDFRAKLGRQVFTLRTTLRRSEKDTRPSDKHPKDFKALVESLFKAAKSIGTAGDSHYRYVEAQLLGQADEDSKRVDWVSKAKTAVEKLQESETAMRKANIVFTKEVETRRRELVAELDGLENPPHMSRQDLLDQGWTRFESKLKARMRWLESSGPDSQWIIARIRQEVSGHFATSDERYQEYTMARKKGLSEEGTKREAWLNSIQQSLYSVCTYRTAKGFMQNDPDMEKLETMLKNLQNSESAHPGATTANSLAHEIPVARGYRFRKIYGQFD